MVRRWILLGLGLFPFALAHYAPPLPDSQIAPPARQFGLPFAAPPGPDTWLLGQLYGNTTGAYRQRRDGYGAGQGIHFGLDLSAPCGTPVVAIGDGVVSEVDGPHGSPPHNVVIDHGNGLASFYGHLQKRSPLKVGTRVRRGQVIGVSGDSQFSCTAAPHLHLEIRDRSHQRFFNPMLYIAADWDSLMLTGGFNRSFQRDLDNPRRWQLPLQQPQARRGGGLLNDFARTWPPAPGSTPWLPTRTLQGFPRPALEPASAAPLPSGLRRITPGGCCVEPQWSADSRRVLFLDKPTPQARLGYYAVDVARPGPPRLELPLAYYSPDWAYALFPGSPSSGLEAVSSGQRYSLPNRGAAVAWAPGNRRVAWGVTSSQGNFDTRATQVFVTTLGGSPRSVATLYGGGISGWLDGETLLLSGKSSPREAERSIRTYNVRTGTGKVLGRARSPRNLSASPGGGWVIYSTAFEPDRPDGLFLLPREGGSARRLPFFGSYRWRDADRLVYVEFKPGAPTHRLMEYDARRQQARPLADLGRKISHDQWRVSPDGRRVVFLSSGDYSLYVLELPR